jgi:diaminopimelate decarboxylase
MIKIYVNEDSYIVNCETGEIYSQDEIEKFISSNVKVATFDSFDDFLEQEKIKNEQQEN